MGRMLETFKLGEGRRTPLALSKPADAAPAQDCVVDWEIGAEVPFVEVGGPNKKMEVSSGLIQHPPQTTPQAPHLPLETAPAVLQPSLVKLTEAKPMTAAFEPWPGVAPAPALISPEIIAFHQPDHAASKEYAVLLNSLRGNLKAEAASVLLLIGMKPNVGTSVVLLNLAVTAAVKQGLRTVIVDASGHGDRLARRLGHAGNAGIAEVLDGSLALEQAFVKTCIASLHFLPAGSSSVKPANAESLNWLIACLRQRYDLIFIDGPLLDDANLALHVPRADAVYLVLPQGESASLHKGAAQSISRMGGRLCGLIHTHFEI